MIHLFHVLLVYVSISLCAYQEDTPRPAAPGAPGQAPRPAGAPAARPWKDTTPAALLLWGCALRLLLLAAAFAIFPFYCWKRVWLWLWLMCSILLSLILYVIVSSCAKVIGKGSRWFKTWVFFFSMAVVWSDILTSFHQFYSFEQWLLAKNLTWLLGWSLIRCDRLVWLPEKVDAWNAKKRFEKKWNAYYSRTSIFCYDGCK